MLTIYFVNIYTFSQFNIVLAGWLTGGFSVSEIIQIMFVDGRLCN